MPDFSNSFPKEQATASRYANSQDGRGTEALPEEECRLELYNHNRDEMDFRILEYVGRANLEGRKVKVKELIPYLGLDNSTVSVRLQKLYDPTRGYVKTPLLDRVKGGKGYHGALLYFLADGVTLDAVQAAKAIKGFSKNQNQCGSEVEQAKADFATRTENKEYIEQEKEYSPNIPDIEESTRTDEEKYLEEDEEPHSQTLILARIIEEIRGIKEENASLRQEIRELKANIEILETKLYRSPSNEKLMATLDRLLSPDLKQNGKNTH